MLYVIDTPSGPAGDGLAVAWIETNPKYVLGMGQNFGLCNQGLVGTAVVADTLDGQLIALNGFTANRTGSTSGFRRRRSPASSTTTTR